MNTKIQRTHRTNSYTFVYVSIEVNGGTTLSSHRITVEHISRAVDISDVEHLDRETESLLIQAALRITNAMGFREERRNHYKEFCRRHASAGNRTMPVFMPYELELKEAEHIWSMANFNSAA